MFLDKHTISLSYFLLHQSSSVPVPVQSNFESFDFWKNYRPFGIDTFVLNFSLKFHFYSSFQVNLPERCDYLNLIPWIEREPVLQFQTLLTTVGPLIQENVSLAQGNSVISAVGGSSARVTSVLYIRTFGDHRYAQESINTPIALQPQLLSGLIWKQGLTPFSNGETDRALHLTRDLFLLRPLQLHLNCSGLSWATCRRSGWVGHWHFPVCCF